MKTVKFTAILACSVGIALASAHAQAKVSADLLKQLKKSDCELVKKPSAKNATNCEDLDLSNLNLKRIDFSYASLPGAELFSTKLKNVDLENSDLQGADLSSSKLIDVDFSDADLQGADFSDANIDSKTDFEGADLAGANFEGASIDEDANFEGADLSGATWVDGQTCKPGSVGECVPE